MNVLRTITSPDGLLCLVIASGNDGEVAVGFNGSDWHTHPDIIASWLAIPEAEAIDHFVKAVTEDMLPTIMSTDGGVTTDPWVSDNLQATLEGNGTGQCILRY